MEWAEIKESIVADLTARGLKDPMIRLKALEKIEAIVQRHYPSYFENTNELLQLGKESFKRKRVEWCGEERDQ